MARPKKDRLLPISLHKDGGNENAVVEPYLTLEERYLTSTCLAQYFHEAVSSLVRNYPNAQLRPR